MGWPTYFALTQAIELPVYAAGLTPHPRWKRVAVGFGASALTHPWVWFVLPRYWQRPLGPRGYFVTVEVLVILVEAAYFVGMGVAPRRALGVSAIANLASATAGVLLRAIAP